MFSLGHCWIFRLSSVHTSFRSLLREMFELHWSTMAYTEILSQALLVCACLAYYTSDFKFFALEGFCVDF